jgi:hypothetical protein
MPAGVPPARISHGDPRERVHCTMEAPVRAHVDSVSQENPLSKPSTRRDLRARSFDLNINSAADAERSRPSCRSKSEGLDMQATSAAERPRAPRKLRRWAARLAKDDVPCAGKAPP